MTDCVIAMQNQTAAERARRTAALANIHAEIVSVDPSFTRHGCSIGIRIRNDEADKLIKILDRKKISYGDIIGRR